MKYNPEMVEAMGKIVCAGIADILIEKKMPQILLAVSEGSAKQIRMVMLDNKVNIYSKEEIAARIAALRSAPGKDVGFSYTAEGVRVIIVPEEMSIFPVLGAPLGAGRG